MVASFPLLCFVDTDVGVLVIIVFVAFVTTFDGVVIVVLLS